MKDKVAQRERTDALVGGARTFNEFVKEKASASNITPACVRSLPEIKEEWKQIKAQQLAEKKAEKLATKEAKKAEKKAEKEAKKATAKSAVAVAKEKTAIKKVAKKSAVDTENIKMTIIEKAHKKSQAEKPPQEPKVKGRPKKYATPEEARRAKIEATKVLNKAKKAQQPPKPPKEPKQKKSKFDPDVYDAELKIYTAKTDKDLDDVLKSIKKASVRYDDLDKINKQSYDHTLQIYTQKRLALLNKRRKEDDEKEAELERKRKEKSDAEKAVREGKAERLKNIEMFKKAKENVKARKMAEEVQVKPKKPVVKIDRSKVRKMVETQGRLEEGEIYEGRGFNPDALKEFNNYDKITNHLGMHLNDLKEAIDPKDLRDYIHFTKEKARLKSKLVGGLVRMIGGELSSSESDSDSDDEMEGGESKGFFGNIKRAFETSWNRPVQSDAERKALDVTLNYLEPALLTPLNILAPPVGKIGEAQRQLMKSKAGV